MISEMKAPRKYTLRKRAEQQEETRARITAAAMALHEELGPARTTVSAIAERAGVERLTVYRHFADDREILQACSAMYAQLHPPPEPASWQTIEDPAGRAAAALSAVYGWYRITERMFARVVLDAEQVPAVNEVWTGLQAGYIEPLRDDLLAAWKSRRRELKTAISHALQFTTWQSLEREGLSDKAKTRMMVRWLVASTSS
jgi:AcrR family transcriptional regulator